jgi:hypothetical protein
MWALRLRRCTGKSEIDWNPIRICMSPGLFIFAHAVDLISLTPPYVSGSADAPPPVAGQRNALRIAIHAVCSPSWSYSNFVRDGLPSACFVRGGMIPTPRS